jgi:hypothetical protein
MNGHLTNDELLNRLYGLAGDDSHLESCAECERRWSDLRARRERFVHAAAAEQEPAEFFALQRSKIQSRLERHPRARMRWVPAAVAAGCLLAAGLFVHRPAAVPRADTADAQLLSEMYSMEQSVEPLAAAPIHALFEDSR